MKFSAAVAATLAVTVVSAGDFVFERLNKNDSMLLVVDIQVGLSQLVRDITTAEYRNSILAHSALANLFDLPVVLTTSADTGPNGPMYQEIIEMHPNAPFIHRQGEVDAWDNLDFQAAVKAANKSQIILAGITTDVCTTFLALSLRQAGYSVWANTEASGTFNNKLARDANRRMELAGVNLMGTFAIVCDLMRDWRDVPGSAEVLPYLDIYQSEYSITARSHGFAVENGTLVPGEQQILS